MSQIKVILEKKLMVWCCGLLNIILFHYAILRLFFFLYDSSERLEGVGAFKALMINSGLILFFSIPHSLLLDSKYKRKLLEFIPQSLYSTFYSIHACLAIVLMDQYWASFSSQHSFYPHEFTKIFQVLYALSWLFMLWAMISTGLFRQSGIEEWYLALKGRKIKHNLLEKGAYSVCRHPIYAGFLAIIWTTPNMSYDHLFLSIGWTIYILVGAQRKEKRLRRNNSYQNYSNEVTAFPFIGKGLDKFLVQTIWRLP